MYGICCQNCCRVAKWREGEANAELNQTTLRADLVYTVRYQGQPRVLDRELQTQPESERAYRMLAYHVALYGRYRKPVISMVLSPFETTLPEPVFQESARLGTESGFQYRVLRVWNWKPSATCAGVWCACIRSCRR